MTIRLNFGERAEKMFGKGRSNKQWRDETSGMASAKNQKLRLEWHNRNAPKSSGVFDADSVGDYNQVRRKAEALQMLDEFFDNSDFMRGIDENTGEPVVMPDGRRGGTDLRRNSTTNEGTLLENWQEELLAMQELDVMGELPDEDRPLYEALQEFMRRRTGS